MPFGQVHTDLIAEAWTAIQTGGYYAFACPRGTGKTTLAVHLIALALLSGLVRFPVVIPATEGDAKKILSTWKQMLAFNTRLAADYWEFCAPFASARGSSQAVLTFGWSDTPDKAMGASVRMSDGLIVLPDSRGVFGSTSIGGRIRGMFLATADGAILRPDMALLDDPQKTEQAKSPTQVASICEAVTKDVLSMAGPGKRIAALMPCTVISPGDVASTFLDRDAMPDWHGRVVGRLTAMPNLEAWKEYNRERVTGEEAKDGGKRANTYYRAHRAELDAGTAATWKARKAPGEVSAIQDAMNDYFRLGHAAFMSEHMNAPEPEFSGIYTIDPDRVARNTNGLAQNDPQPDALWTVAGIDINDYALTWAVSTVTANLSVAVAAYGTHPGQDRLLWTEDSPASLEETLHRELIVLCTQLRQRFPDMTTIAVDGNYQTSVVYRVVGYLDKTLPCRVVASRGMSSQKYDLPRMRQKMRRKGWECHEIKGPRGLSLVYNSHQWHRRLQTGTMLPPMSAGSVTVWGDTGQVHRILAEHVCRDTLVSVDQSQEKEVHKWRQGSGRNDIADAITESMVAAGIEGADPNADPDLLKKRTGKGSTIKPPKKFKQTRW